MRQTLVFAGIVRLFSALSAGAAKKIEKNVEEQLKEGQKKELDGKMEKIQEEFRKKELEYQKQASQLKKSLDDAKRKAEQ